MSTEQAVDYRRTPRSRMCHKCRHGNDEDRKSCKRGGNGNFHGFATDLDGYYFDFGDSWDNECSCQCHF